MRVVALLVVACGCRVGASPGMDATTPPGDGLPERVITDAPLWDDVRIFDAGPDVTSSDRDVDADGRAGADGADAADAADAAAGTCRLLAITCPDREACYPFPFEGAALGDTRCAFQGAGGPTVPCQSQLECDGTTICSAPGQSDSVCQARCDPATPDCPIGDNCIALARYPGVGVCR